MATISKFYLHDAATPNAGTMPSGVFAVSNEDSSGGAAGYQTARSADDIIGALQTSAVITSNAVTTAQAWGYRRFVTAPLAAHAFTAAEGNWGLSYARAESNLAHNQSVRVNVYLWRPSTGARVGTGIVQFLGTEPLAAATEELETRSPAWQNSTTSLDGDILVFEAADVFSQGMATAYTSTFYYDGTTEASTTSCATFITPPVALTLFDGTPRHPGVDHSSTAMLMEDLGAKWEKTKRGLWLPTFRSPLAV